MTLEPLPYHVEVAAELERLEPAAWAAFAAADATGQGAPGPDVADAPDGGAASPASEALDPTADARVLAALGRAAEALGVGASVTIRRAAGDGPPNASIARLPDEVRIVISGSLLDRLDDAALTAVIGHELGHLLLWTADGGRFLVARRLLDALARDPQSPPAFAESARRFGVASEALADRGAATACGSDEVAAAALRSVRGEPRPADPTVEPRAALDIGRLDLLDRRRLEAATRALIEDALASDALRTTAGVEHARSFFPDLADAPSAAPRPVPSPATPETTRYLAYVLLDLATVDPAVEEAGLAAAAAVASAVGLAQPFEEVARRELDLGERAWDRVGRLAAEAARR